MGRNPCCAKEGLNRGAWTAMEDRILTEYITTHGEGKWRNLPKRAGLRRCGKSCRLRWLNYLKPDIKRGNITRDEEDLILRLHKLLGNRWSLIAGRLPGRTDNEIKNYWNTNIGKKAQDQQSPTNSEDGNITVLQEPPSHKTKEKNTKVVHTKASRCTTKVFIPNNHYSQINEEVTTTTTGDLTGQQAASPSVNHDSDVQDKNVNDPALMMMMMMGTGTDDNHLPTDDDVSPHLNLDVENYENSNSSEFMLDFKFDESFILEFLNVDFSQIYNSTGANGGDSTNATSCGEDDYQKLHGPNFQPSMATIGDSEFDWLM